MYRVPACGVFYFFSFVPKPLLLTGDSSAQGLVTNLTLGKDTLSGWTMYSLSIDEAVRQGLLTETRATETPQPSAFSLPTFYQGSFVIPDGIPDLPQDTYIKLPNWRKVCPSHKTFRYAFDFNAIL